MHIHNETFNLKLLKGIFRRRMRLFLIVSSIIFASSILIAGFMPRSYMSTATILIEGQMTEEIVRGAPSSSFVEERLQSITQQILRREKLIEVINQFHLYGNPKDQEGIDSAVKKLRENVLIRIIRSEDLDKRIAFRGRYGTVAFTLSFQGEDPTVVQQVTSNIAELYIEKNVQSKDLMTKQAIAILQTRVNNLKEQLDSYNRRMNDFKRQHVSELPESVPVNLDQIFRLNTRLAEVNAKIKTIEDRNASTEGNLSSLSTSSPNNQAASDPWTRLAQLKIQLESLQTRYSEKHPDVIKTKSEIKRLEDRLATAAAEHSKTSDLELRNLLQQRNEIERKVAELQRKNQMAPLTQSEYSKLVSEYDNAAKQYNDAASKLSETKMMKGIEETQMGERFTIIDQPSVPQSPEKPKMMKIIFAGFLLSIFIAFFTSIVAENLDHSIKSAEQLQKIAKLPVLTVLPFTLTDEEKKIRSEMSLISKILADWKFETPNLLKKGK